MSRYGAVMLSAVMLVGGATAVVAPSALAASTSRPSITFTPDPPAAGGSSATVTFTVNRQAKAIASISCGYSDVTTTWTLQSCGSRSGMKKSTTFSTTLTGLTAGTYTFSVNVTLTDGGRASATTKSFTIENPCLQSFLSYRPDGRLTGPLNSFLNFTLYSSYDGTCNGASGYFWTVVQASSQDAATQLCNGLTFIQASEIGGYYDLPADFYWCNDIGA